MMTPMRFFKESSKTHSSNHYNPDSDFKTLISKFQLSIIMDIEQKQEELIEHFVHQATTSHVSSLATVIGEATSHPSLFVFSEILSVPNVIQLQGTEHSIYLNLLRMFAYGTWSEYKSNASNLPPLDPDQVLKLKQLTVLTLAESNKVLPYDVLMQELDVISVRELEDILINECMYVGIVRGKLDQLRRCFQVQFAAGRDLRPGQLGSMIYTLSNWLNTSDNLLITIQDKIKWADTMSELDKKHKKEADEKMEEVKKALSLKKSQTVSRPALISEGTKRLFVDLRESWTMTKTEPDLKGDDTHWVKED